MIDSVLNLLTSENIFNSILALALICLLSIVCCCINLGCQIREVKHFRSSDCTGNHQEDEPLKCALAGYLYPSLKETAAKGNWSELKKELDDKDFQPLKPGKGSHLKLRLQSLFRALADENGSRTLPYLSDLHELTLQDELSRLAPSVMRTILSCLLILGILGTLNGVHDAIADEGTYSVAGISMEDLAPTLGPSMLAVFCTVLLMWCRGLYIAMVNSYLRWLDTITMTELIPRLQPRTALNTGSNVSGQNISEQLSNNELGQAADNLQRVVKLLSDETLEFSETSQRLREMLTRCKELKETLAGENDIWKNQLADDESTLQNLTDDINTMAEQSQTLSNDSETLENALSLCQTEFGQLALEVSTRTEQLKENIDKVTHFTDQAKDIPRYTAGLRTVETGLSNAVENTNRINSLAGDVQNMNKTIQEECATIYTDSGEIQQKYKQTSDIAQELTEISKPYADFVQSQQRSLGGTLEQTKEQSNNLSRAVRALINTIRKRHIPQSGN